MQNSNISRSFTLVSITNNSIKDINCWGKNIILHLHVFPMHLNSSKHFIIQHNVWTVIRIVMEINLCFARKSHSHSVHVSSPSDPSVFGTFSSPDKTDSLSLHGVCVSVQEKTSHPAKAVVRCVFPQRQQQFVYVWFHLTLKVSFLALCYNQHTAPMVESLPFFFLDHFCEHL